jgi:signal transduction histidine kinase
LVAAGAHSEDDHGVAMPVPPRWLRAVVTGVVLIAAVTALIALLEPGVPALGLAVLYLFAVVPIALAHGLVVAGAVSVASMAAFNFFFLPPRYSLDPGTSERLEVVAAFLLSSLIVSWLAVRTQQEARRSARLAAEQAALRRVATLVARGVAPPEVFAAGTREVGLLLGADATQMARHESDGTATAVATWSADGREVDGAHTSVGAPIVVDQDAWGVMTASSKADRPLPDDAESKIAAFTGLLATAIANAESRAGLARLAEEQASLRRVATLVARGAPPDELFAAVVEEVGRVLPVGVVAMARYEPDGTITVVAVSDSVAASFPVGSNWPLGGENVSTIVAHTGHPARLDSYADDSAPLTTAIRERGLRSSVGTPVVVEGRVWGVMTASSMDDPLPADTEERLASFTEHVATAISNAEARAEVAASRTRIVTAADEERRRVVRDLHDGAQQRLVHTVVTLKLAQRALHDEDGENLPALLTEAVDTAEQATVELRALVHGILPAALTRGGLGAGVEAVASRMPVPVELEVSVGRLPTAIEATAYFVVAEALTNVAKHARAGHAQVRAQIEDGKLLLEVRDDGVGGARTDGSGFIGLADRLAALDGELAVESPAGGGTLVAAAIPLSDSRASQQAG